MVKTDVKKDCFGHFVTQSGKVQCSALKEMDCKECKFYRTQDDYNKNVKPLKYKNKKKEGA